MLVVHLCLCDLADWKKCKQGNEGDFLSHNSSENPKECGAFQLQNFENVRTFTHIICLMPAVLAEARRIRTSAQAYRYNAATREIAGRAAFPVVCRYTAATAVRPPQPARETSCVLFCASRKFACPFQRTNQKSIKPHKFAQIFGAVRRQQSGKTKKPTSRGASLSLLVVARESYPYRCCGLLATTHHDPVTLLTLRPAPQPAKTSTAKRGAFLRASASVNIHLSSFICQTRQKEVATAL